MRKALEGADSVVIVTKDNLVWQSLKLLLSCPQTAAVVAMVVEVAGTKRSLAVHENKNAGSATELDWEDSSPWEDKKWES